MKPEGAISLHVISLSIRDAKEYIRRWHRHRKLLVGAKAAFAVIDKTMRVHGVATIGRPVARGWNPDEVSEITRVATDGTPNACSMLYAACLRWAWRRPYVRVVTYTLASEPGTSLIATGFIRDGRVKGRSWNCKSRPRQDKYPIIDKTRWIYYRKGHEPVRKDMEP